MNDDGVSPGCTRAETYTISIGAESFAFLICNAQNVDTTLSFEMLSLGNMFSKRTCEV